MPRYILIALLLLPFGALLSPPLRADDERRAELKRKLDAALEEFDEAEAKYDEIVRELEHDFDLVRGEHWPKFVPVYAQAIREEVKLLRKDPEHDVAEGLGERFWEISAVCTVSNGRLVKAIEAPIREAAKGEGAVDAAGILAAGWKVVFPEEDFISTFDNHFLDLPQVARYDAAEAAVDKAETEYKAPLPPLIADSGGPEGTVLVPEGTFVYGPWIGWEFDLKKNKAQKVKVKAFFLDALEVTNDEFRTFLKGLSSVKRVKEYLPADFHRKSNGSISIPKGSASHPVTGITFAAASAYARSVGKRLPTEVEWEYAARGADGRLYPWGAEYTKDHANSKERGLGGKQPVGTHENDRSPIGAYDMAGNVSELTSTLAGRKPARGTLTPDDAVVWRGGSFARGKEFLKTNHRWTIPATSKADFVGFRCAISAKDWEARKK